MDSEDYKQYREAQQQRRAERLPGRTDEIKQLESAGYTVVALTDYQFRVNGALDLYPIHRRYHNLKSGKRGNYKEAIEICKHQISH